jgi:hypothetical protein
MPEMSLPVSPTVYDAVLELQRRLQKAYGTGITLSDTVDFLGYQSFLFNGLLGIAETWLKVTQDENTSKINKTLVDKLLESVGAHRPEVATCFVRANVDLPLHWATTRWLADMQGKNIVKCLFEDEGKKAPVRIPEKGLEKNSEKILGKTLEKGQKKSLTKIKVE